jgi:hypothetical protein
LIRVGILHIIHFVTFKLSESPPSRSVSEYQLKALAIRLGEAMSQQGFSVEMNKVEILVGLSPPGDKVQDSWNGQVMLRNVAFFKKTRTKEFSALKRVEWGVHKVLLNDLNAFDLKWFRGRGALSRQAPKATP